MTKNIIEPVCKHKHRFLLNGIWHCSGCGAAMGEEKTYTGKVIIERSAKRYDGKKWKDE